MNDTIGMLDLGWIQVYMQSMVDAKHYQTAHCMI
jgi:hypothetical protein